MIFDFRFFFQYQEMHSTLNEKKGGWPYSTKILVTHLMQIDGELFT